MNIEILDPFFYDLKVKVHREQGTFRVTLPKRFIDSTKIQHGDEIVILVHRHIKDGKIIDFVDAKLF